MHQSAICEIGVQRGMLVNESVAMISEQAGARRILVIDDYLDSRFVTCMALGLRGHTCDHVGTALDAVASISSFRPDVVILEWALRDGSGIGLASRLRDVAAEQGVALRVIAVSCQYERCGMCVTEGFDHYLSKPVAMDELERLVRG